MPSRPDARSRRRERDAAHRADEDVASSASSPTRSLGCIPAADGARGGHRLACRAARQRSRRPSADGRALDERAIALAVVASIRHEDTD